MNDSDKTKKEEQKEGFAELVKTFLYALGLALVFRSLLFEPFHIPSGSMCSTLLRGDFIFVNKMAYGYSRYSFPVGRLLPEFGRVFESAPERGDVIVFRPPHAPYMDFIKRVVGLPGDRIQVIDSILYINGTPLQTTRIEDFREMPYDCSSEGDVTPGLIRDVRQYIEVLPEGRAHIVLDSVHNAVKNFSIDLDVDFTEEYIVPEGHYFFMGDNRDHSSDSRYLDKVGFVPAENIVGKAELIFFSLDDGSSFLEIWKWPQSMREGRFFMGIL